jgi:polyribonucleotide 5'-hydroxyl-kinase
MLSLFSLLINYLLNSTNLDIPHRKLTILAPNQGSVVGKIAIIGSYEWQDQ